MIKIIKLRNRRYDNFWLNGLFCGADVYTYFSLKLCLGACGVAATAAGKVELQFLACLHFSSFCSSTTFDFFGVRIFSHISPSFNVCTLLLFICVAIVDWLVFHRWLSFKCTMVVHCILILCRISISNSLSRKRNFCMQFSYRLLSQKRSCPSFASIFLLNICVAF